MNIGDVEYHGFCKLVTEKVIEFAKAPDPLIVKIRRVIEVWEQDIEIPEVELEHINPVLRLIKLGIVSNILSPEKWVNENPIVNVYVVIAFTVLLFAVMLEENIPFAVVSVTIILLYIYSIKKLLKYVWIVKEFEGFVE